MQCERRVQRRELGAVAPRLVARRHRGEDPERRAHVVVLRAERLGRALVAAGFFVEREEPVFLVVEVLEQRLAQRSHAGGQPAPVGRGSGALRRGEEFLAAAMMLRERLGCDRHGFDFDGATESRFDLNQRRAAQRCHAGAMIALDLDGALALVTLSRAPVNAIDEQWLARLDDVLSTVQAAPRVGVLLLRSSERADRKSTRLNSSHLGISYAVFCLKKKSY